MTEAVAALVLAELDRRGQTLATAESLTGGLLGATLTAVPGASRSYLGGVISYATRLKSELAGVDAAALAEVGPVASRTAEQMAVGVAYRCRADWGIATTGVAGPDPQDGHPVGQVFVAVAQPAESLVRVHELAAVGDRTAIRRQAARGALELLADLLGMPVGPSDVEKVGDT
jgi:nicotinamide-nucleotide amidase